MEREYGFEKLGAWQNSRNLVKKIYCFTKQFPPQEKFGEVCKSNGLSFLLYPNSKNTFLHLLNY